MKRIYRKFKFSPSHLRYRDYEKEKLPPQPPEETKEERIKRVLSKMPAAVFNNPELRLQALKKAQGGLPGGSPVS